MKKTIVFLFSYFCVISLFSCSSEAVTCYLPSNTVKSNSLLVPGGTLKLKTPEQSSDIQYNWSGPNNFKSNLQNPVITDFTTAMAGEYKLKTTKGICESIETSVVVEVNAPNIPCNPDNNTIVMNGDKKTFYYVGLSHISDNYIIDANGYNGDLSIEFADNVIPEPGIYSVCSDCPTSFLKSTEVCVTLYRGDYSNARDGVVYLSKVDGKLTAQFCDLKFQLYSFPYTVSSKMTIQ